MKPLSALAALAILTVANVFSTASAAVVVDGSLDSDYGSAISVQQAATGFGSSTTGSTYAANGSELDALYSTVSGGYLYLFFAGNLETNFNKLDIFIDSTSGGMNRLTPLGTDQGNFNRMASSDGSNGLTFDIGFTADRWISITAGGSPTTNIFVDYANLNTAVGNYAGTNLTTSTTALSGGNGGPASPFFVTLNDSNTGGVTGSTAPNDAGSVNTGIEIAISLGDLGFTTGDIAITAFINNDSQSFLSNQFMSGLPAATGNLGEPRTTNLANIAGSQAATVYSVPEPTSLVLGSAFTTLGMLIRRRKR